MFRVALRPLCSRLWRDELKRKMTSFCHHERVYAGWPMSSYNSFDAFFVYTKRLVLCIITALVATTGSLFFCQKVRGKHLIGRQRNRSAVVDRRATRRAIYIAFFCECWLWLRTKKVFYEEVLVLLLQSTWIWWTSPEMSRGRDFLRHVYGGMLYYHPYY